MTAAHTGGQSLRSGVFICYRRQDSAEAALRVYRLLSQALGEDRVFMDLTIPPGEDFVEWIAKRIGASGVVIPLIGPTWLAADPATGQRRIDDPDDILRNEITGPLERGLAVLPVLAGGAQMPGEDELPPDLARLARIHAHELRTDSFFQVSDERLVQRVAELLGEGTSAPPPPPPPPPQERVPRSVIAAGLSGVALLAVDLVPLWDTYITSPFEHLPVAPGTFTALAPLGILAGMLFVLARIGRERKADWLDAGLLIGFGFAAAAKGVSLLGDAAGRVKGGGLVLVVGGVLVGAAGVAIAAQLSKRASTERRYEGGGAAAFVALLGAAMLILGAVIPFNIASGTDTRIVASDGWLGADPIGIALAIFVAVGLLFAGRRRFAAGLLLALGFSAALLWVRYIGIPVAQWMHEENVASPRLGGVIGFAGSLLVIGAGWRLAASRTADVSAPAPVAST